MTAQIGRLTQCLDLIDYKVGVYEDHLADSGPEHGCDAPPPAEGG
ncbi:hypothetical protein [Nonomuraea sp. NPDC046570]